jgi:hypothetical protein
LTNCDDIGHNHTLRHSAKQKTMNSNSHSHNFNDPHFTAHNTLQRDDDDIDRILAESAAAKSSYDEWKAQLAADCHKAGIAFPDSYALQRAWNAEQKKRAAQRKVEKKKDAIRQRIAQLQRMLGDAKKELDEQEEQLPDFDAIDAELLRIQQQKTQSDEGTKLHLHEQQNEQHK